MLEPTATLPEATLKRRGTIKDAAILYIHERLTNFTELARRTGFSVFWLRTVAQRDGWDEFATKLATKSVVSVYSRGFETLERSEKQMELMKSEWELQAEMIDSINVERKRILIELPGLEVGSKPYNGAVSSLIALRKEVESIVGLDYMKEEVAAIRSKRFKKEGEKSQASGKVVVL